MKKPLVIYLFLLLLLLGYSLYSHAILQNTWMFILLFRIIFPLIMTFAIFLSHKIYHSKENIANLLLGCLLIIPGGLISLFLVMGLQLPGFGIIVPFFLSILLVVILDISIRRTTSKIPFKSRGKSFLTKEIKNKGVYYGLLVLMYSTTIALLTVIF